MTRYWISTSVVSPGTWLGYTGGSGVSLRRTSRSVCSAPSLVQVPDKMVVSAENPLLGLPATSRRRSAAPARRGANHRSRACRSWFSSLTRPF